MTMTGDWTVVDDSNHNNGDAGNLIATDSTEDLETFVPSPLEAATTPQPPITSSGRTPSITMPESPRAAVRFPCSEQPPRFAIRSRNGYYLGGHKKGRLFGRKKRTENDEWTIAFVAGGGDADGSTSSSSSSRPVTIHNHKFGGILALVNDDRSFLGRIAACITPPQQEDVPGDLGLGEEGANENTTDGGEGSPEQVPDDEVPDDEDDPNLPTTVTDQEDLRWTVVPCSGADHPNGGVTIVSSKTGDRLGVTDRGKTILCPPGEAVPPTTTYVWELKCVTGELCFLSNPCLDARIRCDMAGLLTLSPNWKGWEVVRITEASSAPHSHSQSRESSDHHGYVRISSWMHSQWFLCSDATGTVGTCSVAESLAPPPPSRDLARRNNHRCALWAIERYYPSDDDDESKHEGVVLRSVTYGRLLSIRNGLLRTHGTEPDETNESDPAPLPTNGNAGEEGDGEEGESSEGGGAAPSADPNLGDAFQRHTGEMMRKAEEMKRSSQQWWRQSLTNVQKAVGEAAMNRRAGRVLGTPPASPTAQTPEEETIVWQLEAAHLQTYYFVSAAGASASPGSDAPADNNETEDAPPSVPRSIGAFPSVTDNLRKSDKIQFVRNDADPESLKLYLPEEQYFVSCSAKGTISATKHEEDVGTEWILEDRPSGSVFRSRKHGLYLSFRDVPEERNGGGNGNPGVPPASAFAGDNNNDDGGGSNGSPSKKKNPFENLQKMLPNQKKKIPVAELCGLPSEAEAVSWKLEPCTPRAISSKRLKTFAIGTSIAVGTTIAMPFALAGVAAAMGALGAEAGIGFGIVAAGLTGAEALASVGAIGATAYFCFRPEQNSLGGPESSESSSDNETGTPWSKRPFSNWRNW